MTGAGIEGGPDRESDPRNPSHSLHKVCARPNCAVWICPKVSGDAGMGRGELDGFVRVHCVLHPTYSEETRMGASAEDPAPASVDGDVLAGRILDSLTAGTELLTLALARRLGLYRTLMTSGTSTVQQFASAAAIAPRFAREWLEQQAAAGFIVVARANDDPEQRGFALPAEHVPVLVDETSPLFVLGAAPILAGIALTLPAVEEAFTTGVGVGFDLFGDELRDGIAELNRPGFVHDLPGWIAAMPDVTARLQQGGVVLDAGCGVGWSSVALATAFPAARVVGIDMDAASISAATANAAQADLGDRLQFVQGNAADGTVGAALGGAGCDLVTIFEALHDMGEPVEALGVLRRALSPTGAVMVADERVADVFIAPATDAERMQYAISVLHCLPATLAESASVANGTVLRAPTVHAWAAAAGYTRVSDLPIEHEFWRFYRLDP